MKKTFVVAALAFSVAQISQGQLLIDFNSTTQDAGPHNQEGYQPYNAGHEVADDFVTQNYSAFGGTIGLTPTWPDTTDNRVQQMIDRSASFDANWEGAKLDLVTDWLGVDTRTGNGGNGDYDGTTGTPSRMLLTLSGLPAGEYNWLSYHHDTEHIHTGFAIDVSTDGGSNYSSIGQFEMTASTAGGNPAVTDPQIGAGGQDPATLSSTVTFGFAADGASDVVVQFTPYSQTAVHQQIWGINGLEITPVPEPSALALLGLGIVGLALRFRRK